MFSNVAKQIVGDHYREIVPCQIGASRIFVVDDVVFCLNTEVIHTF